MLIPILLSGNCHSPPRKASSPPKTARRGPEAQLLLIEPPAPPDRLTDGAYKEAIESYERRLIETGLARCGGHIKPACRLLGISRTKLQDRIEKYGLSAVA